MLMASNTSKTAKIIKVYYLAEHWYLGNVMVGSITFYDFFAVFDVLLAVNMCKTTVFLNIYLRNKNK